jgi:hypothetical protein
MIPSYFLTFLICYVMGFTFQCCFLEDLRVFRHLCIVTIFWLYLYQGGKSSFPAIRMAANGCEWMGMDGNVRMSFFPLAFISLYNTTLSFLIFGGPMLSSVCTILLFISFFVSTQVERYGPYTAV